MQTNALVVLACMTVGQATANTERISADGRELLDKFTNFWVQKKTASDTTRLVFPKPSTLTGFEDKAWLQIVSGGPDSQNFWYQMTVAAHYKVQADVARCDNFPAQVAAAVKGTVLLAQVGLTIKGDGVRIWTVEMDDSANQRLKIGTTLLQRRFDKFEALQAVTQQRLPKILEDIINQSQMGMGWKMAHPGGFGFSLGGDNAAGNL